MDKEQALNAFWSGFGLVAYDETTVSDKAVMPYITYEDAVSDFDSPIPLTMSLWYRSPSWGGITAKAKEIAQTIGKGGKLITYDGGAFWITLTSPIYARMSEPADTGVRRIIINTMVEFID